MTATRTSIKEKGYEPKDGMVVENAVFSVRDFVVGFARVGGKNRRKHLYQNANYLLFNGEFAFLSGALFYPNSCRPHEEEKT